MRSLRGSAMLAAAAIALAGMSSQAHFQTGIVDGSRSTSRQRRKPGVRVYEPNRADIDAWNKEVERKKAEKRAAKAAKAFL